MGTPDYMAPEQFQYAVQADARSDVYALGCTLYHLLAGVVPFPGSSFSQKFRAHQEQTPPPLDSPPGTIPRGLAEVVRKMMQKQPSLRFQNAAEAATALRPFVAETRRALCGCCLWI